jgi:hypothetical protein
LNRGGIVAAFQQAPTPQTKKNAAHPSWRAALLRPVTPR